MDSMEKEKEHKNDNQNSAENKDEKISDEKINQEEWENIDYKNNEEEKSIEAISDEISGDSDELKIDNDNDGRNEANLEMPTNVKDNKSNLNSKVDIPFAQSNDKNVRHVENKEEELFLPGLPAVLINEEVSGAKENVEKFAVTSFRNENNFDKNDITKIKANGDIQRAQENNQTSMENVNYNDSLKNEMEIDQNNQPKETITNVKFEAPNESPTKEDIIAKQLVTEALENIEHFINENLSDGYSQSSGDESSDKMDLGGKRKTSFRHMKRKRRETTPRPQNLLGGQRKSESVPQKPPRQNEDTTTMTIRVTPPTPGDKLGDDSQKRKNVKRLADPGPEEFHEVAIDVPNPDKRQHISFDIDEDSIGDSFKKKLAELGEIDEEPNQPYEKTKMEKILNIMLCRKDLVNQKLSEKPVKFWDLFKYGSRLDTILVMCGLLLAAMCGICQPIFAILSGRLANTLLLIEIDDPRFFADGTQACILFVVIGTILVVIAFIQFCCFNIACTRITRRIRNAYLYSILRQNPAWFEKNHSGALNTKLNE
uniref:ABC transmembrane type-1 domain-containing protein n=1 Tax=Panagrolaimus sp. PS1159 TaxID=55785 RepID=A0AC35F135_9BILA